MRKYIITICLGVLLGVGLGNWWTVPSYTLLIYFITSLFTLGLLFYKQYRPIWWVVLFGLAMMLGNWRLEVSNRISPIDISRFIDQTTSVEGVIIDDPQTSIDGVKFTMLAKSIIGSSNQPVSGKILVKARGDANYEYGNLITLTGNFKPVSMGEQNGYAKYLNRFDIYVTSDYPLVKIDKDFVGSSIWRFLYQIKHYFLRVVGNVVPEPSAGLLAGLLLGVSSALPKNLLDSFNATGLTHVVALSGFNISIVAGAVMGLLSWLPFNLRLSTAIVVVWLFVLLTGAAPSAVRAGLMGMLILLSNLFGRLSDISLSICLTAVAMVVANPKILMGDIGFQLSFLATIGIIYMSPILGRWWYKWPKFLSGLMAPTMSALIFITPIVAINFGRVSLIAPLTNILVVPLIPLAMFLGFWGVVGGIIQTDLGLALGWVAWAPLRLMAVVSEYFSNFSWASINVVISGGVWVIIYYTIISTFLIIYYARILQTPLKPIGYLNPLQLPPMDGRW